MKKNTKVLPNAAHIKWWLAHTPEIYTRPSGELDNSDTERAVFIGHVSKLFPMMGKVTGKGNEGAVQVTYVSALGIFQCYHLPTELRVIK